MAKKKDKQDYTTSVAKNYLTVGFFPFSCASGPRLCHVKIGNRANSPNKVARHAVYTCCTMKECNIVYAYLYTTAANKIAHLLTKFTLDKKLGGYLVKNC